MPHGNSFILGRNATCVNFKLRHTRLPRILQVLSVLPGERTSAATLAICRSGHLDRHNRSRFVFSQEVVSKLAQEIDIMCQNNQLLRVVVQFLQQRACLLPPISVKAAHRVIDDYDLFGQLLVGHRRGNEECKRQSALVTFTERGLKRRWASMSACFAVSSPERSSLGRLYSQDDSGRSLWKAGPASASHRAVISRQRNVYYASSRWSRFAHSAGSLTVMRGAAILIVRFCSVAASN